MTHTPFLTRLKALLDDRGKDAIYPCIRDLVNNGLTLARFSPGDRIPARQDVTQYISAWCKHAGLTEEDCRGWLIEYCTVMLSSISKTSISGIRHSTKSNVKYIYQADIPFVCELDNNPFRAQCSGDCRAYADMQAKLTDRKNKVPNIGHAVDRPAAIMETRSASVKETYRDQFETALQIIRSESERGTKCKTIIELLNERGLKTRTGRKWTSPILGIEISNIKRRHDGQGDRARQGTPCTAIETSNTSMDGDKQ